MLKERIKTGEDDLAVRRGKAAAMQICTCTSTLDTSQTPYKGLGNENNHILVPISISRYC